MNVSFKHKHKMKMSQKLFHIIMNTSKISSSFCTFLKPSEPVDHCWALETALEREGLKLKRHQPHGESASGLEDGPRGDLSTTRLHKGPASSPTDRRGSGTFLLLVPRPAATKPCRVCLAISLLP